MIKPSPGSRALRRGRYSSQDLVYSITKCTRERIPILIWNGIGNQESHPIAKCLRRLCDERVWRCLGYVLMPDHIHAVIQLEAGDLSASVGRFAQLSTSLVNQARGHKGPFWQTGFYDHALRADEPLHEHLHYMRNNPVRAGLVAHPEEWPYQEILPAWGELAG